MNWEEGGVENSARNPLKVESDERNLSYEKMFS